ncbi:transglutaminaseTgpA domain-containing protein [Prauserella oleivorans]
MRALVTGATESWRLVLHSTWPVQPEPALTVFVPLLTLMAGVLGVELLHRWGTLPALAPSAAVVVLSQFYSATTGIATVPTAVAYAAAAGALLVTSRADNGPGERRPFTTALLSAPAMALAVVGAVVGGVLLPGGEPRFTLRDDRFAPLADSTLTNPLDQIADRLSHPDLPVFTVDGDAGVDRWPVVVLNEFDGVNWTPGDRYRTLGSELRPGPEITVDVERRTAAISAATLDGPWLPSQPLPASVDGVRPLVEERQGSLLVPGGRQRWPTRCAGGNRRSAATALRTRPSTGPSPTRWAASDPCRPASPNWPSGPFPPGRRSGPRWPWRSSSAASTASRPGRTCPPGIRGRS